MVSSELTKDAWNVRTTVHVGFDDGGGEEMRVGGDETGDDADADAVLFCERVVVTRSGCLIRPCRTLGGADTQIMFHSDPEQTSRI